MLMKFSLCINKLILPKNLHPTFHLKGSTFFLEGSSGQLRAGPLDPPAEERDRARDDAHGRRLRLLRLQHPRPRCQHSRGHEDPDHRSQQRLQLVGRHLQLNFSAHVNFSGPKIFLQKLW